MIPVNQLIPHDPERGHYGDCMRACVASLLNLSAEEVPHFMYDNPSSEEYCKRINGFLRNRNMLLMTVPAWDIDKWRKLSHIEADIYHVISDESPRFPGELHAVVGKNGIVVHDPHPTKMGLPEVTDQRVFEFFVHLNGN